MAENPPGLMNQAPQAPTAPQGGMPPAEMPPGEEQLAPEDQEAIELFLSHGINMIHKPKISKGFITRIESSDDNIAEIADITLDIVERLESDAESNGVNLKQEHLGEVANVLMGEIMNIAEASGMEKLSDEQRGECFSLAVSQYMARAQKSGKMSDEQITQNGEAAKQSPMGQEIMRTADSVGQSPPTQPGAPGGGV